MSRFQKLSELTKEDAKKLDDYWEELYGPEYAKSMVTDFAIDGDTKSTEAKSGNKMFVLGQVEELDIGEDLYDSPSDRIDSEIEIGREGGLDRDAIRARVFEVLEDFGITVNELKEALA